MKTTEDLQTITYAETEPASNFKIPLPSYAEFILENVKRNEAVENKGFTENATITKEERSIYYADLGKNYLKSKVVQPLSSKLF